MTDINRPSATDEIAAVIGKSKDTVERMAKKQDWKFTEEATQSRRKKRWYALKELPKAIRDALITYRINLGVNHDHTFRDIAGRPEVSSDKSKTITQAASHGGTVERKPDRRVTGHGDLPHDVSNHLHDEGSNTAKRQPALVGKKEQGRVRDKLPAAALLCPIDSGRTGFAGVPANQGAGSQKADKTDTAGRKDGVLAVNRKGASGGDLVSTLRHGLPGDTGPVSDDRQRLKNESRHTILMFVEGYPGSLKAACEYLTQGYAASELSPDLVYAIDHCNDKLNDNRKGKISDSTVGKWKTLKKSAGHCFPSVTRVKTRWQDVSWLPLFLACYRKPQKPKQTEAYTEFKKDWALHSFKPEELPSLSTINRLLKMMPPIILETGRSTGSEMAALKPFIRRDWSGSSNEVWVGDGHSFKAKVRHPEHGHAFIPEVTVVIDAASRFIVGWAFSLSENQIAVSESLGQAMLKHGKPLIYYSDNGSGQTAKTIDCPVGGMLARMGIRHETGIPGNPQGRGIIEGLWDITAIAAAKTFATFQGTGMDGGALRKTTNLISSAKLKGEVPEFVPSWQLFMERCEEYFDTYNHEHKHSSLGGKTPAEVYFANFDPTWACPLTEDEELNLYRPFVERTPTQGEVRWINNIYFNRQLAELPSKTKVRVAYDMHHAEHVWISDLQGRFICIAIWNGNKVDSFPKPLVAKLKDNRIDGMVKRGQDQIDKAYAEQGYIIEGESEVLIPVPVIFREKEEELIPVPAIPREKEEPLKSLIIEGGFNRQEPEKEQMSNEETILHIAALKAAKNKGG
jgi:putative transposase